jgi:hypothetical protein
MCCDAVGLSCLASSCLVTSRVMALDWAGWAGRGVGNGILTIVPFFLCMVWLLVVLRMFCILVPRTGRCWTVIGIAIHPLFFFNSLAFYGYKKIFMVI